MLPFGNVAATVTINGAELKDYLETAVSSLPNVTNGRFGQVSGLCFTFDIEGPPQQFAVRTASRSRHAATASPAWFAKRRTAVAPVRRST